MGVSVARTDICNTALGFMGERSIDSIETPTTQTERIMARVFDDSRQYCLCLGTWGFATKQANILQTTAPLFGYQSAYQLPDDILALISLVGDPTINYSSTKYRIMEDKLHYNSAAASISIEYIFDQTNIRKWSPAFKELVAYHIAKSTAFEITKKKNVVELMEAQYKAALQDSVIIDGQNEPPVRIERSRALQARLHGSSMFDDPTKIVFDEP